MYPNKEILFKKFVLKMIFENSLKVRTTHCVKSVRIRSYSGTHFLVFGLNTERYRASHRIQSERGKMWIRITPNTDTFHAVTHFKISVTVNETPQR